MSVWRFPLGKNINLCICHDPAVRMESICDQQNWPASKVQMEISSRHYGGSFENYFLLFFFLVSFLLLLYPLNCTWR